MSEVEQPTAGQFEYRAEMQQLLHLIIHSLYTNREIFLRELISNASDALNKARFQALTDHGGGSDREFKIVITLDEDAKTIAVEDSGIGMTGDDLVERIGTIASSGTVSFLEELKKSDKPVDAGLIGQFGVGFYSSFMVANQVEIETRHKDLEALKWTSDGLGTYTIDRGERELPGTKVTLHLKEDTQDFASEYRIREIIRKYSSFVDFPIYLGDDQINTIKALWKKPKQDVTDKERSEFYKFVAGDYEDPMGHLHLHIEGIVNFDAMLFVPARAPVNLGREEAQRHLHLYSSGIFIRNDADDLLPEYLRFVRGVVDTEDLPLNVSREVTQKSPAAAKIRSTLTSKILKQLADWAKDDTELYSRFFKEFGPLLKVGFWGTFDKSDELSALMRFPSTKTEGKAATSLGEYQAGMRENQEAIYYLLAEKLDAARRSPNLEVFRRKDIEVLLLADLMDAVFVENVHEFDGTPLKSVAEAGLDIDPDDGIESLPGDYVDNLLALFRVQLGDKIQDVVASKRLIDSPATLVASADGMGPSFERFMRIRDRDFVGPKKVLEINMAHPLMNNIMALKASGDQDARIKAAVTQVYDAAALLDGTLEDSSSFVKRMTEFMVEATQPS